MSEQWQTSECERLKKSGRDKDVVSPHKTPSIIEPSTLPELVDWLWKEEIFDGNCSGGST